MINMKNKNNLKVLALGLALILNSGLVCAACTSGNKPESSDNEVNEVVSEDNLRALAAVLPKYSTVGEFHDGLACVTNKTTNLVGYINKEGKEVIPCKYYSADAFNEGVAKIMTDENTSSCIDRNGDTFINLKHMYCGDGFHDDMLAFCKDEGEQNEFYVTVYKLGFYDKRGNIAIAPGRYDIEGGEGDSPLLPKFSEGLCGVKKQERLIYIDKTGKEVVSTNYESGGDFKDGMASVKDEDWKTGFIDKTGKLVIPCKYDDAGDFSEGHAFVAKNGKLAIINSQGMEVTPFIYDYAIEDEETEGEETLIGTFSDGLAWVAKNGKYGYVNSKGNVVIPFVYPKGDFQSVFDFKNGIARVMDTTTNKYGFIDKHGKQVIPCKFDEASDFSEGLAIVKIGDRYGFINTEGKSTFDF